MTTSIHSINSINSIRRLSSTETGFDAELKTALDRDMLIGEEVTQVVTAIINDVKQQGDQAVVNYTNKFDGSSVVSVDELIVTQQQMQASLDCISKDQRKALEVAADRIKRYHQKQKQNSWQYEEADGSVYGQKISPLDRVGIYVPGGKANYPSSVLMMAIPAQVAGVTDIIATVPTFYPADSERLVRDKQTEDSSVDSRHLVFAAAALAGVTRLYSIGGAQAIAALAYGTESIPMVDKITGPGNVYVTVAKKLVFGQVGIDMVAGPSELTIICDGKTDPDWIAMDLFSQAEHDEQAQSILICPDEAYLDAVNASVNRLLPNMQRAEIISQSMANRGLFILVKDLADAANVSNIIAPEHLELSVEEPKQLLEKIQHAGAIFLGRHSAEALGDYCAGPSHVLPTSGTARFFSALGVYDFQKRSSIINCSAEAASELAITAAELARNEKLQAHALSAEYRLRDVDKK